MPVSLEAQAWISLKYHQLSFHFKGNCSLSNATMVDFCVFLVSPLPPGHIRVRTSLEMIANSKLLGLSRFTILALPISTTKQWLIQQRSLHESLLSFWLSGFTSLECCPWNTSQRPFATTSKSVFQLANDEHQVRQSALFQYMAARLIFFKAISTPPCPSSQVLAQLTALSTYAWTQIALLPTIFLRRPVSPRQTIFIQLVSVIEFKILWLTLTLFNLVKIERSVPVLFPAIPVIPQINVVGNRSKHRVIRFGKFLQSFLRGESYIRYPHRSLFPSWGPVKVKEASRLFRQSSWSFPTPANVCPPSPPHNQWGCYPTNCWENPSCSSQNLSFSYYQWRRAGS